MTRWSPDTCSCVIDYTDDGNFTLVAIVSLGDEHSGLSDDETYAAVKDENTKKNKMLSLASALSVSITPSVFTSSVSWSFSGSGKTRVLTIDFGPQLSSLQKTTLQTTCDTQFGVGAVVVK